MKNTLNILKTSSVLMALTLCIGVSYPFFANATSITTGDSGTGAVSNTTNLTLPPTGDSGTGAVSNNPGNVTLPATGDSGTGAVSNNPGDVTLPTTGDSGTGAVSAPTDSPIIPTTISSSGGGGSYSSSGSGGFAPLALKTTPATTTTSCPLITSYMQFGANNNGAQVALLQAFLKNSQGFSVDVTGLFDQKTLAAVRAFQTKYLADTMGPWGATQSSGYVYITTSKKINEIACNSPLTLSAADMVIINAYKNAQTVGTAGTATPATLNASTTPLGPQVGANTTGGNENTAAVGNAANTASVVNASVLQRLWSWIKGLFGH